MKTKLLFQTTLLLTLSLSFIKAKAQCPEGNVTFIYQQDVAHFVVAYPNCTHVTGNLGIGEFGNPNTTINDISSLSSITTIDGNLIVSNTSLPNLNGLQNLNNVGGNLFLAFNNQLTSVDQLSNLTETAGINFHFNDALVSLSGLNNITNISGNLRVSYNNSLQNFSLTNLQSIGGYFEIMSNPALISFDGLNNLSSVDSFVTIAENSQLTSIEGLQGLTHVGGAKVDVYNNPQLTSLQGIQNIDLTSLEGTDIGLKFTNNPSLVTCNLPNVCNYLSLDPANYPREISENTGNCTNEQSALAACNLGVGDVDKQSESWNLFYNKQNDSFTIQTDGFQLAEIQVYTLSGQLVKEIKGLNSNREQFNLKISNTVLIVRVVSTEGNVFSKKAMIRN